MKKNFIQIPNDLFESISALGLSKNERRIIDLIIRSSYGIQDSNRKRNEWCHLKQADFAIFGLLESHVRENIERLVSKKLIFWQKEQKLFRINEKLTETVCFDKELLKDILGRNIRKVNGKNYRKSKIKPTEVVTLKPQNVAVSKQYITPKDNKDILNTTVEVKLLKFLEGRDEIDNPIRYLNHIKRIYGEKHLNKLLNIEFNRWFNTLDTLVQAEKGKDNLHE